MHLDSVSVPELVRREATSDTRCRGCVVKLFAGGRGLPAPPGGRPVDHAQHGADRKLAADCEPRVDLLPGPAVHPDFASFAALAAPDEYGTAGTDCGGCAVVRSSETAAAFSAVMTDG